MKFEAAVGVQFPQAGDELSTENAAQDFHGQKEAGRRRDPPGVIGSQSAGRNHAMDMRVMLQFLIPGVQHAKKPISAPRFLTRRVLQHKGLEAEPGLKLQPAKSSLEVLVVDFARKPENRAGTNCETQR